MLFSIKLHAVVLCKLLCIYSGHSALDASPVYVKRSIINKNYGPSEIIIFSSIKTEKKINLNKFKVAVCDGEAGEGVHVT